MKTHTPKVESWTSGSTITCQSLLASCCSIHSVLLCSVYRKLLARHQGCTDKSKRPTLLMSETCGIFCGPESSCPRSLHCCLLIRPNMAQMLLPQKGFLRVNSKTSLWTPIHTCFQKTHLLVHAFLSVGLSQPSGIHAG